MRKARGLTQTQLANKIGITKQSVINYEKGVTFPTGSRLQILLDTLEVSAEQLLGKNLLQSDAEKRMLGFCEKKAAFIHEYQMVTEQEDEAASREFLMRHLDNFENSDLYHAMLYAYDKEISAAQKRYTDEVLYSFDPEYRSGALDMDVYLQQDEEDNEESDI